MHPVEPGRLPWPPRVILNDEGGNLRHSWDGLTAADLRVTLTERHPALLGLVQLREVALDVKY